MSEKIDFIKNQKLRVKLNAPFFPGRIGYYQPHDHEDMAPNIITLSNILPDNDYNLVSYFSISIEYVEPLTYKLFIDDDAGKPNIANFRNPPNEDNWQIAHSSQEAIVIVQNCGLPSFIDFDHDLGEIQTSSGVEMDTSMKFLYWLSNSEYFDQDIPEYKIHSANPEGTKNIIAFMESWKKYKTL